MRITLNISEDDLKKNILNDHDIKEMIASNLYRAFIDTTFNEIKSEFAQIARETIKEVVLEYVENYYEKSTIESDVERLFSKLTKEDLLRLLGQKLN